MISRLLQKTIESRLFAGKAIIVIGARQVGKSTLFKLILEKQDYKPEFGISDCRFSCYARFPIGAYYICPPNNMDGKMQEL